MMEHLKMQCLNKLNDISDKKGNSNALKFWVEQILCELQIKMKCGNGITWPHYVH